jgi:hypothetical protein
MEPIIIILTQFDYFSCRFEQLLHLDNLYIIYSKIIDSGQI